MTSDVERLTSESTFFVGEVDDLSEVEVELAATFVDESSFLSSVDFVVSEDDLDSPVFFCWILKIILNRSLGSVFSSIKYSYRHERRRKTLISKLRFH